jgi:ADP-ribose pyrophosphatase YjhB (NUDIX family)
VGRVPIPDFIVQLRSKVGHDPLWLVGVTAVVLRDEREVLLVRRSDNGAWTPVTGIVDPGEHPAEAAVRETLEETLVTAEVEALAWVNVTPPIEYPNGDRSQYVDHAFRCRYVAGEAAVGDDESVDVGWFPVEALPPMDALLRQRIVHAVEHDGGPTRLDPFVPDAAR